MFLGVHRDRSLQTHTSSRQSGPSWIWLRRSAAVSSHCRCWAWAAGACAAGSCDKHRKCACHNVRCHEKIRYIWLQRLDNLATRLGTLFKLTRMSMPNVPGCDAVCARQMDLPADSRACNAHAPRYAAMTSAGCGPPSAVRFGRSKAIGLPPAAAARKTATGHQNRRSLKIERPFFVF